MIRAGIVGGSGYTGVELLRLLAAHPLVELSAITSRGEAGQAVAELFPSLRGRIDLRFTAPQVSALSGCDIVFFATPHGVAMTMAPELLASGVRIVDLGPDFRLRDAAAWRQWYGTEHTCPELLSEAVYGLPEVYREALRGARLVAAPGCYPTAVQLGFLPLLESGLVDESSLIADAKSGVSGAGRKAAVGVLYAEASDTLKAYAVGGHRHLPEIRQGLEAVAGKAIGLTFVPHLTPMIRGIHATLYARLLDPGANLQALYENRFQGEAFVDVMPAGSHPETRSVRGANICRLAVHRPQNGHVAVVLSVIDNLVKGAAGQAIQAMNVMFGFEETAGLQALPVMP
jgi:N-acetyl-gamma-glutamyl-phosphate reductase